MFIFVRFDAKSMNVQWMFYGSFKICSDKVHQTLGKISSKVHEIYKLCFPKQSRHCTTSDINTKTSLSSVVDINLPKIFIMSPAVGSANKLTRASTKTAKRSRFERQANLSTCWCHKKNFKRPANTPKTSTNERNELRRLESHDLNEN
jgi:hypothetical protein